MKLLKKNLKQTKNQLANKFNPNKSTESINIEQEPVMDLSMFKS